MRLNEIGIEILKNRIPNLQTRMFRKHLMQAIATQPDFDEELAEGIKAKFHLIPDAFSITDQDGNLTINCYEVDKSTP